MVRRIFHKIGSKFSFLSHISIFDLKDVRDGGIRIDLIEENIK